MLFVKNLLPAIIVCGIIAMLAYSTIHPVSRPVLVSPHWRSR